LSAAGDQPSGIEFARPGQFGLQTLLNVVGNMKKQYVKPELAKSGTLSAVTAVTSAPSGSMAG